MSNLKGRPAVISKKRLKAFLYGEPGTGKTIFSLNFPNAYYIDTEKGAEHEQYVNLLNKKNSVIYQTRDYRDVYDQVKALATEEHAFETVIIDPITTIFNNVVLGIEERNLNNKDSNNAMRVYGEAGKVFQRLYDLLLRIDMNVILTSHSKVKYQGLTPIGTTFDAYNKSPYIFDVTLETKFENRKHKAIIQKTRLEGFPLYDIIDFSYDSIMEKYNKNYGKSVPIQLINNETESNLKDLVKRLPQCLDFVNRCLTKADAMEIEELTQEQADKIVSALQKKLAENEKSIDNVVQMVA